MLIVIIEKENKQKVVEEIPKQTKCEHTHTKKKERKSETIVDRKAVSNRRQQWNFCFNCLFKENVSKHTHAQTLKMCFPLFVLFSYLAK